MQELADNARALAARKERDLAPSSWDSIQREFGPDGLLQERGNAWFQVASSHFRAGAFGDSAAYFRRWRDNAEEHVAWHEARGDEESGRYLRQELARHAWSFGAVDLFERYVREGCEPRDDVAPRLDVLAALFLAWAVLARRYHSAHWLACWDAAADEERRRLASLHRGNPAALSVASGIVVDARLARGLYWLGDADAAEARARSAGQAFHDLSRVRPTGLVVHEKRAWRRRMEGLEALLQGRHAPHRLGPAAASFERALAGAAAVHGQDWKDLVLLNLTALRWMNAASPMLDEFARHFPHLTHLLQRERPWTES